MHRTEEGGRSDFCGGGGGGSDSDICVYIVVYSSALGKINITRSPSSPPPQLGRRAARACNRRWLRGVTDLLLRARSSWVYRADITRGGVPFPVDLARCFYCYWTRLPWHRGHTHFVNKTYCAGDKRTWNRALGIDLNNFHYGFSKIRLFLLNCL